MDGVSVKCPICRAASRRNSILDFKVNLILANIIELMEHQTQQPQRSHTNSLTTPQQRSHSNSLTTPQQRSHSNSTNSSPPVLGITSLKVQVLEHKGPMQEMGWTYHQQDLNEKNKGKFIYAGWRHDGDNNPITTLFFFCYDNAQTHPPPGWEWDPSDLNTGARGKFIYMCWKREPGKPPIVDITFCEPFFKGTPPVKPGWILINVDLCQGCSRLGHTSPFIYAYYKCSLTNE